MGLYGWLLTFALLVFVVLLSAWMMKGLQNAATRVSKSRSKDEQDNG